MVSTSFESFCLIASNIFFILPAYLAIKNKLYYEGVLYGAMCIISSLYHVVDSQDTCLIPSRQIMCFATMSFLDFYYSFNIIFSTVFLVLNPAELSPTSAILACNRHIKNVANLLFSIIALALKLEGVDQNIMIIILSGMCLMYSIMSLIFMRAALLLRRLDYWDLVFGVLVTIIAGIFFYIDEIDYALFHSLWHILMAIALCFYLESRLFRWNIFWLLTCHKIAVFKPPTSDIELVEINSNTISVAQVASSVT